MAVAEAAMVLMFSKKKESRGIGFFCIGCRIFGQSGTIAIFFVNLAERFFGCAPAGHKLQ